VRIGLPRALIYYYYYPLWKCLFEQLGAEIVISDITSKELIQKGIKVTVPEICLPIKIFNGHVINLLSKDVDYIFVPRFVSIESKKWFCPKFLGLPELVSYTIDGAKDKILTLDINGKKEDTCEWSSYRPLCDILEIREKELKKAMAAAARSWQQFRQCCKEGLTIEEAEQVCNHGVSKEQILSERHSEITLGVLGYVYNIYDSFVSMDIIKKLRQMDVRVITFEMMDEKEISNRFGKKSKRLYWTFTDKVYGTAANLMRNPEVDGLIHVTAFGCGPDSIAGKLIELDSENYKKPFMTLRVDEHTGESHLLTRIEAFVDMIKRKKFAEQRGEPA
jgi:predicted nucleotide-binding protein (sugar kinase/HSP70/actin superfamily)